MGRPPGARSGGMRRRYPPDWELRDPRFEELDSDEEDEQGVVLDPRARGGFQSDELYFDGYDVGKDRHSRRALYDQAQYGEEFDSDDLDYRDQRMIAYQAAVDKEEMLIQSALERIARARAKGKTNVNLSQEEMEALERRRSQQPEPEPEPPLASPPPTPAKPATATKGKVGSRTNSSTNLASQRTRKKGGSGLFGGSASPAKSNSKAKVDRKPAGELTLPQQSGQAPPGIMVPGPNGVPVYAPIGYYGPPSPEFTRTQSGGSKPNSRPGSRSASKHRRRESTPPERAEAYAQYPSRYYPPPSGMRPESSGSNRSLPDDIDWYPPPPPRHRSASNAQLIPYPTDYDSAAPVPAAQGRRNVSGPADVRYASLRRVPPSSPLARPAPNHASHSDPAVARRQGSGLSREVDESSSSSSSSDDQGVQVEILPDAGSGNGYTINRAPIQAPPPVSGNEGRKRRSGRR